MEKVVISIGGSVLIPEKEDFEYIKSLASMLIDLSSKHKLFVVVGGGRIARYYIEIGRKLGADESYLDDMGIEVTRLNARLLISALGEHAYHIPARNFDEAIHESKTHDIVVMGGTHPGHTTDGVAAMLGERVKADRLVNATSVDGVYTSDPKKNKRARRIERMSYQELIRIAQRGKGKAGPSIVFDPLGASLVARSKVPLLVVDGRDLSSLKKAIMGKKFRGTKVE